MDLFCSIASRRESLTEVRQCNRTRFSDSVHQRIQITDQGSVKGGLIDVVP
jgi:hypothetical protein